MEGHSFTGCPSALASGVFDSVRSALRIFWRGVSASTPFIGAAPNNFSHFCGERLCALLSRPWTSCSGAQQWCRNVVHWLFDFAADPVADSATPVFGFGTVADLNYWGWHVLAAKKSAARGSPLAATGIAFNRICSLLVEPRF
jgi:hypothetical protein